MQPAGPLFGFIPAEYAGFTIFVLIIAGVIALLLWAEKTGHLEQWRREPASWKPDETSTPITQYNAATGLPEASPGSGIDVGGNVMGTRRDD